MAEKGKQPTRASQPDDSGNDAEFRFALKELLAAFEPVIAENLELLRAPDKVQDPGDQRDCEAEIALAHRIFGKFWSEKVALAVLPKEVVDLLSDCSPRSHWS
jgi:hypothetical protein